jgi:Luciferase-like monooxygenase.
VARLAEREVQVGERQPRAFKEEQARLGIDTTGREYPIVRELYIADTDEQARAEVEPYIGTEYKAFSNYDEIYAKHYEEMWEKAFLIGSPETVAEKIEILPRAAGRASSSDRLGRDAARDDEATIQRFTDEVMPRFAKATAGAA